MALDRLAGAPLRAAAAAVPCREVETGADLTGPAVVSVVEANAQLVAIVVEAIGLAAVTAVGVIVIALVVSAVMVLTMGAGPLMPSAVGALAWCRPVLGSPSRLSRTK